MQREYFCCGCGLFHWVDLYKTDSDTGKVEYVPYRGCPNEECLSHEEPDIAMFAVDTIGYAYFAEGNREFINRVKWCSPKYAPQRVIDVYEKQGIPIR